MNIKEKKIVVVGGTQGVGFAVAEAAAARGARVVVASRSRDRVDAARARIEGGEGFAADFTDADQARATFEEIGPFDHLVVSAADNAAWGPFDTLPFEAVVKSVTGKIGLAWNTVQAALPHLAKDGSVTLISGAIGRLMRPGTAGVSVVNAGINQLTRVLSKELAPLRVNAVSPGTTDTEAYAGMPAAKRETMFANIASGLPVGRVGRPDEIAAAVLLCVENGYLTGAVLDVDGGAS